MVTKPIINIGEFSAYEPDVSQIYNIGDRGSATILEITAPIVEESVEIWGSGYRYLYPTEYENAQLMTENKVLRKKIQVIEKRLTKIEAIIPKERLVILREVSREEAKEDILGLFHQEQILYYSDIAEQLGLDLKLVVEICNELQSKGEIQVVDDALQRG